ncbi:MAG: hypothetical protein ACE5HV_03975 [Acidobacteriota bacterium]
MRPSATRLLSRPRFLRGRSSSALRRLPDKVGRALLALLLAGAPFGLVLSEVRLPQRPLPPLLQQALDRQRQSPPISFDEPEAAEHFFARKRIPENRDIDVRALTRRAQEHVDGMRRYSSRWGRYLTADDVDRELEGALAAGGAGDHASADAVAKALGTWKPLGPGNIGGRTRVLLIDPRDDRVLIAGGVSGGIWKSTDGGQLWLPVGEKMANIAINSMARSPVNPDVLYAGTGEGYFREDVRGTSLPLRGDGIFKSTNNGNTWKRLKSTDNKDFYWVNDLAFSPTSGRRIYAATRTGVWRSKNGGKSWSRILAPQVKGGCLDLAMRSDRDTLFASCGTFEQATVYRTDDADGTAGWQAVLSEPAMGRTTIALAPSDQDVIYALAASNVPGPGGSFEQGLHAVFRSTAGGDPGTWVARTRNSSTQKASTLLLTNPINAMLQECGFSGADNYINMGWYANALAVDPADPQIVWAAAVDWFRSDDGGQSWGAASYWWDNRFDSFAHADQHVMVFHPDYNGTTNQTAYIGNDGGIFRTEGARAAVATGAMGVCSGGNTPMRWTNINNNYGVTQFYHGVVSPDGASYFGGTQDNGTILGSNQTGFNGWSNILGGDGGYSAIDPDNPQVIYAESQWANLAKSVNGGGSFFSARNGLPPVSNSILKPGDNWAFITPLAMDPGNSQRLWIGGRQLWRTDNAAGFWQAASAPFRGRGQMTAIAVSPHDSDRVIAGASDGRIYRTDKGTTSTGFTTFKSKRPRRGWVSWIALDPNNADVVYATYATFGGKHVFRSTNGGQRFRSIDGSGADGLPDIPVHSIVVDAGNSQRLYLGTDLGVLVSTTGGNSWAAENTGFGNIVTEALVPHTRAGGGLRLFAFTHGRGAWRVRVKNK